MEALIINLTRMGDIVQSTPLMDGLKKTYSGCRITYLANAPYADICQAIPFIDNLLTFDMECFQGKVLSDSISPVENYKFLKGFLDRINVREYDLLINLTPSRICAVLTSLIHAKEVRGLTIDSEGHRFIKDPWMRYFASSVFNRAINPFNLVDMYIKAGGVENLRNGFCLDISRGYEEKAAHILKEAGIKDGDTLIGFQAGASKEHKMWSPKQFALLGKRLVADLGVKVILFGSNGERHLGEEIKKGAEEGVIDLMGRTSLMELAALLKRCKILVTNDSGTMHIATAVGTMIIALSLGAAYFRETGPYGEGHIVIKSNIPCHPCNFHVECKEMVCRDYITVENVHKIVEIVLGKKNVERLDDLPFWKGVQVYTSLFDAAGFLEYIPCIERLSEIEDIYLTLYKILWETTLNDHDADCDYNTKLIALEEMAVAILENGRFRLSAESMHSIARDVSVLQQLMLQAEKGISITNELMNISASDNSLHSAKEFAKDIACIDKDIENIGFLNQNLRPITAVFGYQREALEGDNISAVAEEAHCLYLGLKNNAAMMLRLLDIFMQSQVCDMSRSISSRQKRR